MPDSIGLRVRVGVLVLIAGGVPAGWAAPDAAGADPTADAAADAAARSLPPSGVLASVSQSWRGADDDIVYAHFDLGATAGEHRYYCLIDARTGKREPNGVLGEPFARKDGSSGIHMSSVSLYRCDDAQRAGYLDTAPYHLTARAAEALAHASLKPAPAATAPSGVASSESVVASAPLPSMDPVPAERGREAGRIEVGGVRLGMSVEQVRSALHAHALMGYLEWREPTRSAAPFISRLIAWTPPGPMEEGESIEVLLTPQPGHERAYAIVHTRAYAPARALPAATLAQLLVQKYAGFSSAAALPAAPLWRLDPQGRIANDDPCDQRGVFGGLREIPAVPAEHLNPVLSMSREELESQASRCGSAIVTEDQTTRGGASHEARRVTRFTVTAFSPLVALEGLSAVTAPPAAHRPAEETPLQPSLNDL